VSEYPVIFELDVNGEATGIVHFYCCVRCRFDDRYNYTPSALGTSADWVDGTVCETCGRTLQ